MSRYTKQIWENLKQTVEPSKAREQKIEVVWLSLYDGGVKATVAPPEDPKHSAPESMEDFDLDELSEGYPPSNEEMTIYSQVGTELKAIVISALRENIERTPATSSVEITSWITATEDHLRIVADITLIENENTTSLHHKLGEALENLDYVDDESQFVYGTIRGVYYSENMVSEGWEVNGTLYKYNEEPWNVWSAPPDEGDESYPANYEEWIEFVSDNEIEEVIARSRETFTTHFHPTLHSVERDNPLVEWFHEAEEYVEEAVEVSDRAELGLTSVSVDRETTTFQASVTITLPTRTEQYRSS